ncbi:hypothetical protein LEP1GSC195_2202 [Leptospira wolbachii serovar Codice str. CDC]|uniref:Uncharacterized protein n=1 Tax=Leptospira wolbachii serovar Codice str. CDC TaxID=1218599 RepID=R9A281_9LEPT|nr:hypothetical protein LEP1GSC195_2202 [Leptospira wolbachii serovar Codice str. CDC]
MKHLVGILLLLRSLKENILRQSMQQSLPGKIPSIQYSR